ncbi:hypothetical protein [Microcoleus sp. FACHB-672]|uniref:hypothetical protein n=1 Tax=Microcoleus sp. FACHB-672 TaxID=2692825 RepID=UPI00168A254E|nr:hypothetical protein [Microcoleus sp. FACHB-672]MBD2041470.1 hypothetical protein [Microcoleus sp. FACHB-672]
MYHQSTYNAVGTKTAEYNPGSGTGVTGWAPIRGVSYNKNLTSWHNGQNSQGSTIYQDDMAVVASPLNGFGYRTDDHGNTNAFALVSMLAAVAFIVSVPGILMMSKLLAIPRFQVLV